MHVFYSGAFDKHAYILSFYYCHYSICRVSPNIIRICTHRRCLLLSRFSQLLLTAFLVTWFVCGNVWVFGVWRPNFRQLLRDPNNWCDRTAYMFAFSQIIVCHIVLVIGLIGVIVAALCRCSLSDIDGS